MSRRDRRDGFDEGRRVGVRPGAPDPTRVSGDDLFVVPFDPANEAQVDFLEGFRAGLRDAGEER